MDDYWTWVGNWSEKRAILSPNKVAIMDNTSKESYTFLELDKRANKIANFLVSKGIKKGDRIGVFSKNRVENIDLFNVTGKLGAILVPFNIRLSTQEILYLLKLTKPTLLFYDATFDDKKSSIAKEIPDMSFIPFESTDKNNLTSLIEKFGIHFERIEEISFEDPHLILFTGGTTGLPKGAVLSHKLIFWNSVNTITSWGLHPDDIQPLVFPLYHTGGWNVLFVPFYHIGATTILMGDFDPDETLRVIEDQKCTIIIAVPTIFQMIAESPKFTSTNIDLVRVFISGGAPCPLAIMEKYWKRNKPFKMGYGLTEVGPNNFYLPEDVIKEKPLSVGFPVMHCDMKIVDDDNNTVIPGEVGELCLRGPHSFSGYWENEQETKKVIDIDGWVHTGDLARTDEEGYYYIVDRKKDMFISGGENIFPVEIEEVVYKYPGVLEVAVFGVKDDKWGEVGVCAISGVSSDSEKDIKEFIKDKLAKYKHPKYYMFLNELPKSSAGKILRREVKKQFKK